MATMLTKALSSEQARNQWRDVIDAAVAGENIIIERYGKPTAVMISYQDFAAIEEIMEDLRDAREAQAALEEWRRDPSQAISLDDFKAELIAEGLLDG
jgi:prevent-host-death family protein